MVSVGCAMNIFPLRLKVILNFPVNSENELMTNRYLDWVVLILIAPAPIFNPDMLEWLMIVYNFNFVMTSCPSAFGIKHIS